MLTPHTDLYLTAKLNTVCLSVIKRVHSETITLSLVKVVAIDDECFVERLPVSFILVSYFCQVTRANHDLYCTKTGRYDECKKSYHFSSRQKKIEKVVHTECQS